MVGKPKPLLLSGNHSIHIRKDVFGMTDLNSVDTLMEVLENPDFSRVVVDAVLDGETPVKVLAAQVGIFGDLVPLAVLLTWDMYDRVTPAESLGLQVESDEQAEARIRRANQDGAA